MIFLTPEHIAKGMTMALAGHKARAIEGIVTGPDWHRNPQFWASPFVIHLERGGEVIELDQVDLGHALTALAQTQLNVLVALHQGSALKTEARALLDHMIESAKTAREARDE